jgi:hypothetical protein
MAEHGEDQITVTVEARRSPHDRHDPVGLRKVKQAVNFRVRQMLSNFAELHLRVELLAEQRVPAVLIGRERLGAQIVALDRRRERFGGETRSRGL